jgi:hypothetical protein
MPGTIHPGLPFADHLKLPGFSQTAAKHMLKSAASYRWWADHQDTRQTDAQRLGTAVHALILEPESFDALVVVWDGGRRSGNAWHEFQSEHNGKTILRTQDMDTVRAMANAVWNDEHAGPLVEGATHREVSVQWTQPQSGVECKGRLDLVANDTPFDLKTTKDANPRSFARDAFARFGYHVQAGAYVEACNAVDGLPEAESFGIIAVENKPPYLVQVYTVGSDTLAAGRSLWAKACADYAICQELGQWPGYGGGVRVLEQTEWGQIIDLERCGEELPIGGDDVGF